MVGATISHICKQRWVSSICTAAASFILIITALMGPFNPTPIAYASNRLLALSAAKATFSDDFENQEGSAPSGTWQVSHPNCQGTGTVTVDRTVAHSGNTSIRVNGRAG